MPGTVLELRHSEELVSPSLLVPVQQDLLGPVVAASPTPAKNRVLAAVLVAPVIRKLTVRHRYALIVGSIRPLSSAKSSA